MAFYSNVNYLFSNTKHIQSVFNEQLSLCWIILFHLLSNYVCISFVYRFSVEYVLFISSTPLMLQKYTHFDCMGNAVNIVMVCSVRFYFWSSFATNLFVGS